ncbi:MAG: carboxypeptidase-like regulatory domain-containing protein [Candidatus Limnocylindrales bacterium]
MSLSTLFRACALVLALAACSTAPGASPSTEPTDGPSGITGIVLVGPDCRRPTEASPCLVPYQARLVILDPDGGIVGEVTSGLDGTFRIELPPGDYVIQPSPGGDPYPRAEARSVTVVAGELSEVEIDYERGRG